jgi:hypothetical protein
MYAGTVRGANRLPESSKRAALIPRQNKGQMIHYNLGAAAKQT